MPRIPLFTCSPWKLPFLLGLALGFFFFQSCAVSKAWALDPNSPLFDQSQNAGPSQTPSTQPMALPEETPSPSPGLFSTLLRLVLALGVTLGLVVATVWVLKWVWERKGWNQIQEEGKAVRVLSTTYLAPRKSIHLVEVGKRILVVGVGNEEIQCLDVIQEPGEVEALRGATGQQGFPNVFNRVLGRHETEDSKADAQRLLEESRQAVSGYVDRLKKMRKKKNDPESTDEK